MALVYTPLANRSATSVQGQQRIKRGTIAFDSSYPTGGEALDLLGATGLTRIDRVQINPRFGYVFTWDYVNSKMLAYQQSAATGALTEVTNTADLSAVVGVHIETTGA